MNSESTSNYSSNNISCSRDNTNILSYSSMGIKKKNYKNNNFASNKTVYNNYYAHSKITSHRITKYEKTKIIGIRAQMIANGSKPFVKFNKNITSAIEIAELEFNEKKIPLIIRRYITNNKYEDWRLEDFTPAGSKTEVKARCNTE